MRSTPWVRTAFLSSSPVVLAHRGFCPPGTPTAPNTAGAFAAAVLAGSQHLETDLQATRDGVVVVYHDATVDDATDGSGAIRDLTWQHVSNLAVRSAIQGERQRIPQLHDLLDAFPEARFNLDIKTPEAVAPLTRLLVDRHRAGEDVLSRICIASFSDRRRRATLRRLPKGVCSSAGARSVLAFWLCSRLPQPLSGFLCQAVAREAHIFQVPRQYGPITIVDARFVQAAHRHGRHVHVWTVNDARVMRELLALGVDGLVTDRTDVALSSVAAEARRRRAEADAHRGLDQPEGGQ